MKSIYLRNFVSNALVVSLCFMMVVASFISLGRGYMIREHKKDMELSAAESARMAAVYATTESLGGWGMGMTLTSIANSTDSHVFVTDENGIILSCSDSEPICRHIGMKIEPEIIDTIKNEGKYDAFSDPAGMYDSNRYIIGLPISNAYTGDKIIGYTFISSHMDRIFGAWASFLRIAALIGAAVFIATLALSLIQSRRMARPLDEMAALSRKFARGDFSHRVRQQEDPSDEMGALIESFNSMADSLEKADERRAEFVANVSHELRTPMTTIAGFADGILDGTVPKEQEEFYLRAISDETKRLSRLVRDMLDVSQMQAGAMTPRFTTFDLTELVLQTLLRFESRATKKKLDVDLQLPDTHLMVVADRDAITRVLYNLADNAVKFAAEGTCITVRLYKDSGKAYASIKDIGETIPPEDLPFIFDRFHKSDRSRSLDKDGVGLGLYLVKAIINSHDEDIAVKSAGGATEFVFTLKLAE